MGHPVIFVSENKSFKIASFVAIYQYDCTVQKVYTSSFGAEITVSFLCRFHKRFISCSKAGVYNLLLLPATFTFLYMKCGRQ